MTDKTLTPARGRAAKARPSRDRAVARRRPGNGRSVIAEAEQLYPVRTVRAVLEALRYDVMEGANIDKPWFNGIVRCEVRDFVTAHVVGEAIRAGVDPWLIIDHLEGLIAERVRVHEEIRERAGATFLLGLVDWYRRGGDHEEIDDYDFTHGPSRKDCLHTIIGLAGHVVELADKPSTYAEQPHLLARTIEDSILDIVRDGYALGYGPELAEAIIDHAAALLTEAAS